MRHSIRKLTPAEHELVTEHAFYFGYKDGINDNYHQWKKKMECYCEKCRKSYNRGREKGESLRR